MQFRRYILGSSWLLSLSFVTGCGDGVAPGVTGTAIDTYDSGATKVNAPVDPAKWIAIDALVEESGELTSYPASIEADGTFKIPDVPGGPYLLAITSPPPAHLPGAPPRRRFIANTARELDLGHLYSYRQGIEEITKPTFLTIDAPLTVPWQALETDDQGNVTQDLEDSLEFVSRAADVQGGVVSRPDNENQNAAPLSGALALNGWKIDAMTYFQAPHLVRGDKEDDFAVLHNVAGKVTAADPPPTPDTWPEYTFDSTQEIFRPSAPITMTDGGSTKLSGTFEAIPQKTFSFDYRGSAFSALLGDAPPIDSAQSFVLASVEAQPSAPVPAYGGGATLLYFFVFAPVTGCQGCPGGAQHSLGDHQHAFSYGNPFESGQELAFITFSFQRRVPELLPGDKLPSLRGSFTISAPVAELSGTPIQPVVSLPRNVKVNDQALPTDHVTTGVGETPEISFDAPSMGIPDSYGINIIDLDDQKYASGPDLWGHESIASFWVPSTSTRVKIPDGLLEAGNHYYIRVSAYVEEYTPASPNRLTTRYASATTFTGILVP